MPGAATGRLDQPAGGVGVQPRHDFPRDAGRWTEGELGICPHLRPCRHAEMEALGDRCEREYQLHHCECVADAQAWTSAERKIRELRQGLDGLLTPALGLESLGLCEEARIAVDHPLAQEDCGAAPHPVAADAAVGERLAADDVRRRVEPHRLERHHLRVFQIWAIVGGRIAVADDTSHFGRQFFLGLRMLRKQVPRPGEGERGRLMAGEEERHCFVAHLAIRHLAALLVACGQ